MAQPRLDLLIYAHDGRGLGHVSRSVAVGMAVRRRFPQRRVLLVTGCPQAGALIGRAPLDWLKLPSYRTEVIDGVSRGCDGYSGYSDGELGALRSAQLKDLVTCYRPCLVLVDHTPQGKHRELIPALETSGSTAETCWVLGVRGLLGEVPQAGSRLARDLYQRYYSALFWYGDRRILGADQLGGLQHHYRTEVQECGYVSRLREYRHHDAASGHAANSGIVVALPWFGEATAGFARLLLRILAQSGGATGEVHVFVGNSAPDEIVEGFRRLAFCRVSPFSSDYLQVLCRSRGAVIFGGYNSLVDVLAAQIPALVILRTMRDREQQLHLEALMQAGAPLSIYHEKDRREGSLAGEWRRFLARIDAETLVPAIDLDGAGRVADLLHRLLPGR